MEIRKPLIRDVPAMADLINAWAAKGQMLPRSRHAIYEFLRDFVVAEEEGMVIGCGALHIIWEDMAEIRSLAVAPEQQGRGVGRRIVERLIAEARSFGVPQVFALTYREGFFAGMGFHTVSKDSLPHKIWGDCLDCPKFPNCDEIAMIRPLQATDEREKAS
ncbi:MAG: N-acetyltransferase [Anaerolineae bacterium]|nr:N-acetyltransferase [Anaerolineae bacterium]